NIVDHWLERAQGLRTIAFAISVEDSKRIVEEFVGRGVRAVHLDGKTPPAQRKQILEDLKAQRVDVVSTVDIWIEGVDIVSAKCAIIARPTKSLTVWLQSCGRIVRPWEGVTPVILDHAGNARRHGPPTLDREYSLTGRVRVTRKQNDDPHIVM